MIFKKREATDRLEPEARFEAVYNLTKDLPKPDFRRLMDGVELAWQGYDKALRVQTREEKENSDIYSAEEALGK